MNDAINDNGRVKATKKNIRRRRDEFLNIEKADPMQTLITPPKPPEELERSRLMSVFESTKDMLKEMLKDQTPEQKAQLSMEEIERRDEDIFNRWSIEIKRKRDKEREDLEKLENGRRLKEGQLIKEFGALAHDMLTANSSLGDYNPGTPQIEAFELNGRCSFDLNADHSLFLIHYYMRNFRPFPEDVEVACAFPNDDSKVQAILEKYKESILQGFGYLILAFPDERVVILTKEVTVVEDRFYTKSDNRQGILLTFESHARRPFLEITAINITRYNTYDSYVYMVARNYGNLTKTEKEIETDTGIQTVIDTKTRRIKLYGRYECYEKNYDFYELNPAKYTLVTKKAR